jgi:FixJ family two-component response regulator
MTQTSIETFAPIVHVVEDDPSACEATARFLRGAGHVVRTYATAQEFLDAAPTGRPGCVVLDLLLPGPSGLEVQEALAQSSEPLPVVFLSGEGRVPDSVQAMKLGAVDFLTKTVDGSVLLDAVSRALVRDEHGRRTRARKREVQARYDLLSPRERDVFAHLISGQLNKQVGFDLGVSEHTVKIHRGRIFQKMRADSIADLVRMAAALGIEPAGSILPPQFT